MKKSSTNRLDLEDLIPLTIREHIFRLLLITVASVIMAINIKSFVDAGSLFPGGFNGLTLLLQRTMQSYFHLYLPFSVINFLLNLIPAVISYRFIGKRFTIYSCLMIVLTSILTDLIPSMPITDDILLSISSPNINPEKAKLIAAIPPQNTGESSSLMIHFPTVIRSSAQRTIAAPPIPPDAKYVIKLPASTAAEYIGGTAAARAQFSGDGPPPSVEYARSIDAPSVIIIRGIFNLFPLFSKTISLNIFLTTCYNYLL